MSKRILAVASSGGHWEQLRLRFAAFEGADVCYASTCGSQTGQDAVPSVLWISDYNKHEVLKTLYGLYETYRLCRRLRPDVVIFTGAAPGLLCLLWGRLLGARTIWVDSIANADRLSLSGRVALRIAHLVLTQWEHLATEPGCEYRGSVI